jgi:hypothetical protein
MPGNSSASGVSSTATDVVPLPYALYESLGLLFELYNGGQRPKRHEIHWVRLNPILVAQAAPHEPKT